MFQTSPGQIPGEVRRLDSSAKRRRQGRNAASTTVRILHALTGVDDALKMAEQNEV
jgi:hypothetical protein